MGLFNKQGAEQAQAPAQVEDDTVNELRESIGDAMMPESARNAALKELDRVERADPSFPEHATGLNYVEFLLQLPWRKSTADRLDLDVAEAMLHQRHAGLEHVKERIIEHLALAIMRQKSPLQVLVADDEPIALQNMGYALRKDGYAVHEASGGVEALSMFEEHEVDVLITDLKMPDMDGLELLKKCHTFSPGTDFLVVTGHADVQSAIQALKLGAVQYLTKPIKLDSLRGMVAEAAKARRRKGLGQGPVLCFTGPPGTGKTSIGKSIAEALGRKFIRLSMSGMRDEAELKGHRRTYVGALPGRILSELKRVESNNPVLMLDEVDKASQGFRGDPTAVLLEMLDPEQNTHFLDYYTDVPFDLSSVLFVTTANDIEELSRPLRDRMEVIRFSSYTPLEKLRIAREHLTPTQIAAAGLRPGDVAFTDEALQRIILGYTMEAGVRNLNRSLAAVCRKLDRQVLKGKRELPTTITDKDVVEMLGPPPTQVEERLAATPPGTSVGLVWTETGGHLAFVETASMQGSGKLIMTGSLGKVLRESARTGLSFIRGRAAQYGLEPGSFLDMDVHVHIPAGAVPKDGPSAGLTLAMAMLSCFTNSPVRPRTAMTGEMTLSGRVLPVSGLRDKILAAAQAGVDMVIVPAANKDEVASLSPEERGEVELVFAAHLDDAQKVALPLTTAE